MMSGAASGGKCGCVVEAVATVKQKRSYREMGLAVIICRRGRWQGVRRLAARCVLEAVAKNAGPPLGHLKDSGARAGHWLGITRAGPLTTTAGERVYSARCPAAGAAEMF
jgi:hypothetical protein